MNTAFVAGIGLNLLFVMIELAAGLWIHSLSLLSDAGHNLADVGALGLSLLAYKLLSVKSNSTFTYGFSKTSILVALTNAVVLLLSVGAMAFEAVRRMSHPEPLPGGTIALVAGVGIVINATTAMLFMRGKHSDINIRGAYLHLMSDAAVSFGIVIGGVTIMLTGWYWLDPVLCLVIAVMILASTWSLLRDSVRMSLDAVPSNVNLQEVQSAALAVPNVKNIHHIHLWMIGARENALTAHVVMAGETAIDQELQIKLDLKRVFAQHNVHHVTLEMERDNEDCAAEEC